jgi:hypothetical protein
MSLRRKMRTIVALAAAYATALQATLLVIGGPIAGGPDLATTSLCLSSQPGTAHPPPGDHQHDCWVGCAACGCGGPAVPDSAVPAAYEKVPAALIAATVAIVPTWRFDAARAHRSRAPPLG